MYNKNSRLDKENNKLTVDNLFDLILIKKREEGSYTSFNYKSLKVLFENYGKQRRFFNVYDYIETDNDKQFDFEESIKKNIKNNNIILSDDFVIVSLPEHRLKELKKQYNEDVYLIFNDLIFTIIIDLNFGYGKWFNGFDEYDQLYYKVEKEIAPQMVKKTK